MNYAKIRKTLCCIVVFVYFFNFLTFGYGYSNVYYCFAGVSNKIALTFDDGPHPKITLEVLKVLEKHNVKATFFVIGQNVDLYKEQLVKIKENGHEIGNHTNTHKNLTVLNEAKIEEEILLCHQKVFDVLGYNMNIVRPPCGRLNKEVIDIIETLYYKTVLWSVDTNDWSHTNRNAIVKNVIKNVKGGDIILFHDYISGKYSTVEALDIIIPYLKKQGFEFVTVGELINKPQ